MNRICTLLNIQWPIFLGGMAHVSRSPLVAAVSEAGGLGLIGSGGMSVDVLQKEIHETRKLTSKPFGVNLMLMDPNIEQQVSVVIKERVHIVTTGAGNPTKYFDSLKSEDIRIVPVAPAVALARRMERAGADGVIAEGTESGGHVGDATTMALIPQIVDAVEIPVVAAGGIADGRGMAAALALGADAVQIGTRFVASQEAPVHQKYKQAIVDANERSTIVTGKTLGAPVRTIANKMVKKFASYERDGRPFEEFEELAVGGLRRAVYEGDIDTGSLMAGQISGLIHDVRSVEQIMNELVTTARSLLKEDPFL